MIYYRDADGDGFGDSGNPSPSCNGSPTVGVVNNQSDCDDTRASVHPGGVEVCNGLDDDCNAAVDDGSATPCSDGNACTTSDACTAGSCTGIAGSAPGEVHSVSASKSGEGASFAWPAIAGATVYDTLRGRILAWPVGANPATELCFDDGAGTSMSDYVVPPEGDGFWYLVRGVNACGNGSYGSQASHGVPTVPRLSGTCP